MASHMRSISQSSSVIWPHVVSVAAHILPSVIGGLRGSDTRPTLAAIATEIAGAEHLMPGLCGFPFAGAWAGLRPMTPSGRPAIGPIQALEGLYATVGHYTDGVILGPSTGEVVRELLVGDGTGRAALARYHAAGLLSDPATS